MHYNVASACHPSKPLSLTRASPDNHELTPDNYIKFPHYIKKKREKNARKVLYSYSFKQQRDEAPRRGTEGSVSPHYNNVYSSYSLLKFFYC